MNAKIIFTFGGGVVTAVTGDTAKRAVQALGKIGPDEGIQEMRPCGRCGTAILRRRGGGA